MPSADERKLIVQQYGSLASDADGVMANTATDVATRVLSGAADFVSGGSRTSAAQRTADIAGTGVAASKVVSQVLTPSLPSSLPLHPATPPLSLSFSPTLLRPAPRLSFLHLLTGTLPVNSSMPFAKSLALLELFGYALVF